MAGRRRRNKEGDLLAAPTFDPSIVENRPADSSWVSDFLAGYELDKNVGFAVRNLFRNTFYLPVSPYKMVLQILRGKEYIRQLPPPEQYSDVQIDTRLPRNTNEEPLIEIAALTEEQSMKTEHDIRAGGLRVEGAHYTWGRAVLALRHVAKLVGMESIKHKGKPEERSDSWKGPFETPLRTAFHVLSLVRRELGDMPGEVTTRDGTKATFIETVHIGNSLDTNLAVPHVHRFDNTVEVVVSGGRLDDALLLLIKRVAEEGHQADVSPRLVGVSLEVVLELQGGSDRRVVSFQMSDLRTRRQQVMAILKAAVIDGGDIALKFIMSMKRILPSSLVAMATDAPYQFVKSNVAPAKDLGYDEDDGRPVTEALHSEGYVSVTRRYKFTWKDTTVAASNKSAPKGKSPSTRSKVRCFHKLPFESFASGIFFDHKNAELYRAAYNQHMYSMKNKVEGGRDMMVNDVIRDLSSSAVKALDRGEPGEAARVMMILLSVVTPTRTSSTYSLRQAASLLRGACGLVSSTIGAAKTLREAMLLLRSVMMRNSFNVNMCNVAIMEDREEAVAVPQAKPVGKGAGSKAAVKSPEQREMRKIANLMITMQGAVREFRSMLQNLNARSMESSALLSVCSSLVSASQSIFDPRSIIQQHNWPENLLGYNTQLHAWRRELLEHTNTLHNLERGLEMVHKSMCFDIMLELLRTDEDMWDRRKIKPLPTLYQTLFGTGKGSKGSGNASAAAADLKMRKMEAAFDLLVEQTYLGPGLSVSEIASALKKGKEELSTAKANNIPEGLFEEGFSLKSVYEPPLTFSDALSFMYSWHAGLAKYGRLVLDPNTELFVSRALTVFKDTEEVDRRAARAEAGAGGSAQLDYVWISRGVPSEEASLRGFPELSYRRDGGLGYLADMDDAKKEKKVKNAGRGLFLGVPDIEGHTMGRDKVKYAGTVAKTRHQWASTWILHSALGTHWMGRQGAISVTSSYEEELMRGDSSSSAAMDMVKIRYLHETRLTQALEEGYYALATMPQRRNPYAQLNYDLQRYANLFYMWRFADSAIAARLGGLWPGDQAAAPKHALRAPNITAPKNYQGAYYLPLLEKPLLSSALEETAYARASNRDEEVIGDMSTGIPRKPRLSGGLYGPPGLLHALGNWTEVIRQAWTLPPVFSSTPTIVPQALASLLAAAPNSRQRFSSLDRKALKDMTLSVHSGLAYDTARKFGRPPLHRDLQPAAVCARSQQIAGGGIPPLHLHSQDPDMGLTKGASPKLRLEMAVRVDVPYVSASPAMERAYIEAAKEVFAETIESCLRHMATSRDWLALRLFTPEGRRFTSKLHRISGDQVLAADIHEAVVSTCECTLDCFAALPIEPAAEASDNYFAVSYDTLVSILQAVESDGDDPTAHDSSRIAANRLAPQRVEARLKQEGCARAYQAVQLSFTLLVVQTRQGMNRNEKIIPNNSYNTSYSGSAQRNQIRLLTMGRNNVQNLAIGRDDTVARLLASTLWLSPAAASGIWSVAGGTLNIDRCIRYEAVRSWRAFCAATKAGPHRFIEGYDRAWLAVALSSPDGPVAGSPLARFGPQLARMDQSLARKLDGVLCAVDSAVEILSRASGANAMSINASSFGQLMARNVCLSLRLCLQSPQSVSLRGGAVTILKLLEEVESLLSLGRFRLVDAHRIPSSQLPGPESSVPAYEFSETRLQEDEVFGTAQPEQNPDFPPTRDQQDDHMSKRLILAHASRRSNAADEGGGGDRPGAKESEGKLRKRITEIETCKEVARLLEHVVVMSRVMLMTCASDVHRNVASQAASGCSIDDLLAGMPTATVGHDPAASADLATQPQTMADDTAVDAEQAADALEEGVGGDNDNEDDDMDVLNGALFHNDGTRLDSRVDGVDDGVSSILQMDDAAHDDPASAAATARSEAAKVDPVMEQYMRPVHFHRGPRSASNGAPVESDLFARARERAARRHKLFEDSAIERDVLGSDDASPMNEDYVPASGLAHMRQALRTIDWEKQQREILATAKTRGGRAGRAMLALQQQGSPRLDPRTGTKGAPVPPSHPFPRGEQDHDGQSEEGTGRLSDATSLSARTKSMKSTVEDPVAATATVAAAEAPPQAAPVPAVAAAAPRTAPGVDAPATTVNPLKPKSKGWGKLKLNLKGMAAKK